MGLLQKFFGLLMKRSGEFLSNQQLLVPGILTACFLIWQLITGNLHWQSPQAVCRSLVPYVATGAAFWVGIVIFAARDSKRELENPQEASQFKVLTASGSPVRREVSVFQLFAVSLLFALPALGIVSFSVFEAFLAVENLPYGFVASPPVDSLGALEPKNHGPGGPEPRKLAGFVTMRNIRINTPTLEEGKPLQITVHVKRDGAGEVHGVSVSPNIAVVNFNKLPIAPKDEAELGVAVKTSFAKLKKAWKPEGLVDFPSENQDMFQTANYLVTSSDIDGFVTGQSRIYLFIFIAWKDSNNTSGSLDSCVWLQAMPSIDIGLQEAVWHKCN